MPYMIYADYMDSGSASRVTVDLPDDASYDQVADVVRILFRAGTLAAQDTERDNLASTRILPAPLLNEGTGRYEYLNRQ
ncbi:MAG: hypothetical protein ABWX96_17585 [Propionibacteriaceae bacterium]